MKKVLTVVSIILCCFLLFACTEKPVEEAPALTINAYVTLYNAGTAAMQQTKVQATDLNNDNKINIDEVLVAAHKDLNRESDYASATAAWGLSITKLLGDASGNFGYYVNDVASKSLDDEVKAGDYLTAYVYVDGTYWSDTYTYFDIRTANAVLGTDVILSVSNIGYVVALDDNGNPIIDEETGYEKYVPAPVATVGATITVNGEATDVVTDADGVAKISFDKAGTYIVSATSTTLTLVPPVCVVTVK